MNCFNSSALTRSQAYISVSLLWDMINIFGSLVSPWVFPQQDGRCGSVVEDLQRVLSCAVHFSVLLRIAIAVMRLIGSWREVTICHAQNSNGRT